MSYLPYLLEALPSVRQPGKIVGPFADLMGKVNNLLFDFCTATQAQALWVWQLLSLL